MKFCIKVLSDPTRQKTQYTYEFLKKFHKFNRAMAEKKWEKTHFNDNFIWSVVGSELINVILFPFVNHKKILNKPFTYSFLLHINLTEYKHIWCEKITFLQTANIMQFFYVLHTKITFWPFLGHIKILSVCRTSDFLKCRTSDPEIGLV